MLKTGKMFKMEYLLALTALLLLPCISLMQTRKCKIGRASCRERV